MLLKEFNEETWQQPQESVCNRFLGYGSTERFDLRSLTLLLLHDPTRQHHPAWCRSFRGSGAVATCRLSSDICRSTCFHSEFSTFQSQCGHRRRHKHCNPSLEVNQTNRCIRKWIPQMSPRCAGLMPSARQ